jgi:chromosome segregation ATPase
MLTEIREIHEELRVTEATQILLAELEMQQSQVNRAEQRVDEAQSKLSQLKTDRRYFEGELARSEDALRQATEPLQQRQLTESIESLRIAVEKRKTEEQESSARVQQVQELLRNAEEAFDRIQDELNTVIKGLRANHARK